MAISYTRLVCSTAMIWLLTIFSANAAEKQSIKAVCLPIADHYAGFLAHEKYGGDMKEADFTIEFVKNPGLLRAYFETKDVDIAFIPCPIAMDMFAEKADFRWASLAHRDGTALAINDLLDSQGHLPMDRSKRLPDNKVAEAFKKFHNMTGQAVECAVPDLLATHTVILYKYLKDNGLKFGMCSGGDAAVIAVEVAPPQSPAFIKKKKNLNQPAAFEQSLPWADMVETQGYGHVAWYSRDVMKWPKGHVECIVIAKDECIKNKRNALKEVIYYLHKSGLDIERARLQGGSAMTTITDLLRAHIPQHTKEAIIQSLRLDLMVINYLNLNVDKAGLRQIMDLAIIEEAGILKKPIDIDAFTDESFSTEITKKVKVADE